MHDHEGEALTPMVAVLMGGPRDGAELNTVPYVRAVEVPIIEAPCGRLICSGLYEWVDGNEDRSVFQWAGHRDHAPSEVVVVTMRTPSVLSQLWDATCDYVYTIREIWRNR